MEIRTLAEDEVTAFQEHVENAFGGDPVPEETECWRPLIERDRALVAWDGDTLVGTTMAFTFDMTVPGRPLPVAGVTMVGVVPTHRRQGVLRSLMNRQLGEIRERGVEPVASLWASEAVIYGRFGYGVAGRRLNVTVEGFEPTLLGEPPAGTVRRVRDAGELPRALYDAVRATRPGMISRSPERWTTHLADVPQHRHGASSQRIVVYERDGAPYGYAIYRQKGEWGPGGPKGEVRVKELIALDPDAHVGLWRYLTSIDLMRSVTYDNLPSDDPLFDRLADPRAVRVNPSDGLYVRVLDVEAAFAARSYDRPGRVVVEVVDDAGGWAEGRWLLDVSPDGASCTRTTQSPDVSLGAVELGALYLGDTTLRALHAAGRVDEHVADAVEKASPVLAWPVRAWCPEIF